MEYDDSPMPIGPILESLSILVAMGYRRAPVPIPDSVVRWFVNRSAPPSAEELGGVVRLCTLLGDSDLVLRALKRSWITAEGGPLRQPPGTSARFHFENQAAPGRGES
jgi:hypothetical protein